MTLLLKDLCFEVSHETDHDIHTTFIWHNHIEGIKVRLSHILSTKAHQPNHQSFTPHPWRRHKPNLFYCKPCFLCLGALKYRKGFLFFFFNFLTYTRPHFQVFHSSSMKREPTLETKSCWYPTNHETAGHGTYNIFNMAGVSIWQI